MSVRRATPVGQEPVIDLILWSIWRTERNELHLVGVRPSTMTGRVSSPVTSLDALSHTAVSVTGRKYRLIGPSGHHENATYVWRTWCALYRVLWATEVTRRGGEGALPLATGCLENVSFDGNNAHPIERTKAVIDTRRFLWMLAETEEIGVTGLIQSAALCLLRHYPLDEDIAVSANAAPELWAPPTETDKKCGQGNE